MELGIICPTSILHLVKGRPYHLVLAHMVEKSKAYRDFYRNEANNGSYITLDNSSFEVGDGVYSADQLIDFALDINATEVMAPETYLDALDTTQKVLEFCDIFYSYPKAKNLKVFATLHGTTPEDVLHHCFIPIANSNKVHTIGLSCRLNFGPKVWGMELNPTLTESLRISFNRINWVNSYAHKLFKYGLRCHLLGLNHPFELAFYKRFPFVESNDSSAAVTNGLLYSSINNIFYRKPPTKLNFELENINRKRIDHIKNNIDILTNLV